MALRPQRVRGVELRRRRPRYPGEPLYARIDLVRSRKVNPTDQWDLVYSSYPPHRAIAQQNHALMNQQQQWGGGYPRALHNQFGPELPYATNPHGYHQLQGNAFDGARPWPVHDVQQIPPPPPHHGGQRLLTSGHPRHQGTNGVWPLGQAADDEDEDDMRPLMDSRMPMIEPRWPQSRGRGHDFRAGGRQRMAPRYDAPMDESDEEFNSMPFGAYGNRSRAMAMPRAFEIFDDDDYNLDYGYGRPPHDRWG